jgi:alkylation response protein AidB-like acyl-CoA dehydrogenase
MAPLLTDALWTEVERAVVDAIRDAAAELTAAGALADQEASLPARLEQAREGYRPLFELGLHRAVLPQELNGLALSLRARTVALEEVARADAGLAMALAATWGGLSFVHAFGTAQAKERFVAPCATDESGKALFAVAVSEPDSGSDALNFVRDASLGAKLEPKGDGFVLSGTKWMMTNGSAAQTYVVGAQTFIRGFSGRAFCVVPGDAKGLSVAGVNKRGLRSAFHATAIFDQVEIPAAHVLALPRVEEKDRQLAESRSVAFGVLEMAAIATGIAQAALDEAEAFTAAHRQGGSVVARHQAIALRLSELFAQVAAARALTLQAAQLGDAGVLELSMAAAARTTALDAARNACRTAVELVGSAAIEDKHRLTRLARDAETMAIPMGTPDLLRLLARGVG